MVKKKVEAAYWVELPPQQWIYYRLDRHNLYPHCVMVDSFVRVRFKTKKAAEETIKKLQDVILNIPLIKKKG